MSVRVINLARYNTPDPVEKRGKQWVSYGESNDFYEELLRLKDSPTNSALINGITEMMYGRGLAATDGDKNPEGYANAMGLFKEDVLRCVMDDFYTLGQGFFQVIKNQSGSKIVQLEHIPTQYLRPEKCDEEGNIRGYYYHEDWPNLQPTEMPERIAAFGFGNGKEVEVLCISSYKSGHFYFSPVEYQSGLDYAAVEVEVANFHLNNIMNGFSSNMIINFNNGVPQEDEKDAIERKINDKFTGADNAGRVVIAFNDGAESAANIESVQLNNAHDQYQFLSDEAAKKLMVSHRVTSPILLGISHNTGLGNNADELRTASVLFDNTVIKPLQRHIIKALNEICEYNNYSFKWYFKTLQPVEFIEVGAESMPTSDVKESVGVDIAEQGVVDEEKAKDLVEKEASYNGAQIASAIDIMQAVSDGVLSKDQAITFLIQMLQFEPSVARALFSGSSSAIIQQMRAEKKHESCCTNLSGEDNLDDLLDEFLELGESEEEFLNDWELVEEAPVDYENEEDDSKDDKEISTLRKVWNFVSTGSARPDAKSEQDTGLYKVRYQYAPLSTSPNSRDFCKRMVSARKLYRKEDIIAMGDKAVNPGWGPGGSSNYSIWYYKGGGDCHHFWMRKVFKRKRSGGKFLPNDGLNNDKEISVNQARREDVPLERNDPRVSKLPTDMPNNGFLKPRG